MIVVDTNIICYLFLNSKYSAFSEELLLIDSDWSAPLLWRSEFRNVLALYLRKKIIDLKDAMKIIEEAEALMKDNEYQIMSLDVLNIASQCNCSAYDCEFIALSKELNVPLITTDNKIIKQFPSNAFSPSQFIEQGK